MIIFGRNTNNVLNKWWAEIDKVILFSTFALCFIGFLLVLSSSPFVAVRIGVEPKYFIFNHILYLIIAVFLIVFISVLSKNNIIKLALFITVCSILAMVVILFASAEVKGAKRWLYIFKFSLQPSEFAKVCFPIILAFIWYYGKIYKDKTFLYLSLLLFFIIFVVLLLLQPDVGMTFLITIVFFAFLILTGINLTWILTVIVAIATTIIFAYFTFTHVQYRVNNFLSDSNNYQVNKSIEAIAKGQLLGEGSARGIIKRSLPDAHTDFVFAVASEEFGIIFAIAMLGLYLLITYRIFRMVSKSKDVFVILSSSCLSIVLLLQVLIHVFSNLNLIPTKGMTMPFLSYGGSSLIATSILIGFLLALSKKDINNITIRRM